MRLKLTESAKLVIDVTIFAGGTGRRLDFQLNWVTDLQFEFAIPHRNQ